MAFKDSTLPNCRTTLTKEHVGMRNHRMFRDRQEMWLEKIQR